MSVQDLLGRALRDVRVSVLDQCNYRCPYCMPSDEQSRITTSQSQNPPLAKNPPFAPLSTSTERHKHSSNSAERSRITTSQSQNPPLAKSHPKAKILPALKILASPPPPPKPLKFLTAAQRMTTRELSTLIKALLSLGMQKLRLTGGEPLLRKDLPEVITEVRALSIELGQPLEIALTTNASRLSAQAQALFDAGLDRLTISLDSLDPERFAQLSGGRGRLSEVLEGIAAAQAAGFARLKLNCVVQKGVNETDVLRICEHFRGTPHTPRFIEYMDVGTSNGWQASDVVSSSELIARIAAHYPLRKIAQPMMGEVAQRYAYADGAGEIGFVSSISAPFCRGCTRARVAADGKLFTCLFSTHGHDLKALLGTGDYALVARAIRAIWAAREDRYSELRAQRLANKGSLPAPEKAEMYHLGG